MESEAIQKLLDVGGGLGEILYIGNGGVPHRLIPNGWTAVSMEYLRDRPTQLRGAMKARDVETFAAYVKSLGNGPALFLDASAPEPTFHAILDFHQAVQPGHCRHTVDLVLEESVEWQQWKAACAKPFTQVGFAEFLRDHLEDIQEPEAASLLEMALSFEVRSKTLYKAIVRLEDGAYQIQASNDPQGNLALPPQIVLGLRVWRGTEAFEVGARLSYRIEEDKLRIGIALIRPERVVEVAAERIRQQIVDAVADDTIPAFNGYFDGKVLA